MEFCIRDPTFKEGELIFLKNAFPYCKIGYFDLMLANFCAKVAHRNKTPDLGGLKFFWRAPKILGSAL